jgi:DNA-binding transcriptional MocR family regulator
MSRVTVSAWLKAIETQTGPMPPELRHLCYVLARFMSGDGSEGCFPGTRTLAVRIGVHHSTVARRLKRLRDLGWLDVEQRKCQWGHVGGRFFPSIPMSQSDATIPDGNGASRRDNPANVAGDGPGMSQSDATIPSAGNVAGDAGIVAGEAVIVAPECDRLLQTLTEKSAASPARGEPRSAAPRSEQEQRTLRAWVADLRAKGQAPEQIAALLERWYPHLTPGEVETMT